MGDNKNNKLVEKLYIIYCESDYSQEDIAKQIGITQATFNRIINHKINPSQKAIYRIKKFLAQQEKEEVEA